MTTGTEGQPRSQRRIPVWGWILGALFFPPGIFIVLAVARVLTWWRAIVLALLAYGLLLIMVHGMAIHDEAPYPHHLYMSLGFLLYVIAVGQLQYAIGQKRGLWSNQARRIWKIFGYVAVIFFAMQAALISVTILLCRLYPDYAAFMSRGGA
jgi:hypothetical protein